jgi:hypothetical protein
MHAPGLHFVEGMIKKEIASARFCSPVSTPVHAGQRATPSWMARRRSAPWSSSPSTPMAPSRDEVMKAGGLAGCLYLGGLSICRPVQL